MKKLLKKIIKVIMSAFKIKNIIILESKADFSDNTRAFYDYLLKKGYNKKYKIYWFVENKKEFKNRKCENVKFINMWHKEIKRTPWQWLKYFWIVKNAKYLIYSNRTLLKLNKKSIDVFLNHGIPLKNVADLKIVSNNVSYATISSDFCINLMHEQLHLDKEKFICLGNPRDDVIFHKTNTEEKLKNYMKYDNIILWLPTFRKSSNSNRNDSNFQFPLGLPIIYSEDELIKLNNYLKSKNMAILFKLHPSQDTSMFKTGTLSNIIVIDDQYLINQDVELCELYKITDALITDYSSVYYDYLLLNKIIGFTLDDYEEYKKEKGFAYDNPLEYMAGEKIYNINDLYKFIDNINCDIDEYKNQREKMKKLFYKYEDGKSCERIAKFLKM